MGKRWTLRRRLVAVLAAMAVGAALAGGATAYEAWRTTQRVQREQHVLQPAESDVRDLLAAFVDQETGERGYVLTQNPTFLQPFMSGRRRSQQLIAGLRRDLGGDPQVAAELGLVAERYDSWFTLTAAQEVSLVTSGRQPAAVASETSGAGKARFDSLRGAVGDLQALVDVRVSRLGSEITAGNERSLTLITVLTVLSLLAFAAATTVARRWVLAPIDRVARAARRVAAGELDRPVESSGPPELAALGSDVEGMRRRLRDELLESQRSREALEHQAPLLSAVRRELAPTMAVGEEPVKVHGRLLPAAGVLAGDWFDVFNLKPGIVTAVLVDISGHGPEAGLFAYRLKHLLTAGLRAHIDPGAALGWVADQLGDTDERFATVLVLSLDLRLGRCEWANAGHPAGLRYREGGFHELEVTGPLLGPVPGTWTTAETDLRPSDLLIAYSDGITEAHLPGDELFGELRLRAAVGDAAHAGPGGVVDAVLAAVDSYTGERLADDATIIALAPEPWSCGGRRV